MRIDTLAFKAHETVCAECGRGVTEKQSAVSLMQSLDRGLSDMMMRMKMNEIEL